MWWLKRGMSFVIWDFLDMPSLMSRLRLRSSILQSQTLLQISHVAFVLRESLVRCCKNEVAGIHRNLLFLDVDLLRIFEFLNVIFWLNSVPDINWFLTINYFRRAVELLLGNTKLLQKVRIKTISRVNKIWNVKLSFQALDHSGFQVKGVSPEDIVNCHREKTMSLLWQLFLHFQVWFCIKFILS